MIIPLRGHTPRMGHGTWTAPTAVVIGDVTVGRECGIWFGAVIRADEAGIVIGDRSNVQDGCVLHADPGVPLSVGTGVSVGHNATLHGCTIGDDVLVGMGAIVLNRAVVGSRSLIAAGALVPEGFVVPDGTLVAGVPAKVRRELSDHEVETVRMNARNYVSLASTYRSGSP